MAKQGAKSKQPTVATADIACGDKPPGRSSSKRSRSLGAAALLLLIAVTIFAGHYVGLDEANWIRQIEDEIRSWGPFGVVASIGIMVVHSLVPFPAEFLAIANGMLFGLFWGVVITWTGAMLGAFVAFGLARLLGRPFVERAVRKNDWQRIDRWAEDQGWQVLLISRFIPVIAFNLINYTAGLTKVSWFTFAWTTGVGILPVTILMVLIGHNVDLMTWQAWLLLIACGLVMWLAIRFGLSIYRRSRSNDP